MRRRRLLLWVFADQWRADFAGFAGHPDVSTPHLERLAREGVVFDRAVSGSPLCCPFRGSLLTGLYPHRAVPGHEFRLDPATKTAADYFAEHGFHTAYVGKWHLDGFHEREGRAAFHIIPPERRGRFAHWEGYENNNSPWDCWTHGGSGATAFHQRLPGYETDELTNRFVEHLRQQLARAPEQSIFGVLSVQPPHDPYVAPAEWMARHRPGQMTLKGNVPAVPRVAERARQQLAGYAAMIENFDWNIGRLRAALEALGVWEDTTLLVFSDHGDLHGSHGAFGKTSPWEEAIRVPLIIGGGVPYYGARQGRCDAPWNHVDYLPTSLGLCDLPIPTELPGYDYSHRFVRRAHPPTRPEPDSAFLQIVVPTGHANSLDRPWRGIVTRDGWKYAVLEGQPFALYHLNEDPLELANQAFNRAFAAERARLQARLAQWLAETGDTFALPAI